MSRGTSNAMTVMGGVGGARAASSMASKSELFKIKLFNFSCLQLLCKPHLLCLMVTDAASGSLISNYLLLQVGPEDCFSELASVS